jgi:hypothetical protein
MSARWLCFIMHSDDEVMSKVGSKKTVIALEAGPEYQ